jgi:hypothetical protein
MTDRAIGSGDFSIGSTVWPGTSKLIEEMGELQQVLGKLIATAGDTAHWSGDLRQKLVEEIADVISAILFFERKNLTFGEVEQISDRRQEKFALFEKWHANPEKPVAAQVINNPSLSGHGAVLNRPHCEVCKTEMVLHFWDRPGGPSGNGFRCPKCHPASGKASDANVVTDTSVGDMRESLEWIRERVQKESYGSDPTRLMMVLMTIERAAREVLKKHPRTIPVGPPTTHILFEGQSLCGFLVGHLPSMWPDGHNWVSVLEVFWTGGKASIPNHTRYSKPCDGCLDRMTTSIYDRAEAASFDLATRNRP